MAALRVLLALASSLLLLLGRPTQAKNDAPCQRSKWNNAYDTFVRRHIRAGVPNSLDQNEWERYLKNNGGCDRPTQSFLHPDELDRVKEVCTSQGGKVYKGDLCISLQPFTFITVRSERGTCLIKSVHQETKHLILACELLENQCVPVHFEGNADYSTPSKTARGCQDPPPGPNPRDHAAGFRTTWFRLLSLILITYLFIF